MAGTATVCAGTERSRKGGKRRRGRCWGETVEDVKVINIQILAPRIPANHRRREQFQARYIPVRALGVHAGFFSHHTGEGVSVSKITAFKVFIHNMRDYSSLKPVLLLKKLVIALFELDKVAIQEFPQRSLLRLSSFVT